MNITEIKKVLYKEKPIAEFVGRQFNGDNTVLGFLYDAKTSTEVIHFTIPVADAVESMFRFEDQPSQLLIRWFADFYKEK